MAFKFQTKFGSGWFAVEADDYDNFFADLSTVYGGDKADKIVSGIAAVMPLPSSLSPSPTASPSPRRRAPSPSTTSRRQA